MDYYILTDAAGTVVLARLNSPASEANLVRVYKLEKIKGAAVEYLFSERAWFANSTGDGAYLLIGKLC